MQRPPVDAVLRFHRLKYSCFVSLKKGRQWRPFLCLHLNLGLALLMSDLFR